MKPNRKNVIRKALVWVGILCLVTTYVVVAGKTKSCPACVAVTQFAGVVPVGAPAEPDYPEHPLQVGDKIPRGILLTETGEPFDLNASVAGKPTVLVFYRGGWCPYCNRHLAALSDIDQQLRESGFQILAVSADRPELLRAKEAMEEAPYTILSDSSMEVSRSFGIAFRVEDALVEKYKNRYSIDLEADSGHSHHLLPHPSVFIIDTDGVIRFQYTNEDYKVRLEPEEILMQARKIVGES